MIITKSGTYQIEPITCVNAIGNPYRLHVAEVTKVDMENHKIYCPGTGWIDWDLLVMAEKRKTK